jgi:PLD-like domain
MASVKANRGACSVSAYRGDAKTLLAFDLAGAPARKNLAGFTIAAQPPGQGAYYLHNQLRFAEPGKHAQDPKEPAFSTINAPIHKFRWVHFPGLVHQGLTPTLGTYTYAVTPRYFDGKGSMLPLDPDKSVPLQIDVDRFTKGKLSLGFTRGYVQSQAFVRHFGLNAAIRPRTSDLIFDTSQLSGTNAQGDRFTFAQQYAWLGYTARERILGLLAQVAADRALRLDVFAYDLNEPDVITDLLGLAAQKQLRIILDDSTEHHSSSSPKPEDKFAALLAQKAAGQIKRGHFGRFAHDKVFIVSGPEGPRSVLTGSTNFSVSGLYVNSNHVLVFDDPGVAKIYGGVFDQIWANGVSAGAFSGTPWATRPFSFQGGPVPSTTVNFSPHLPKDAQRVLDRVVQRIGAEEKAKNPEGSVLFAVMQLTGGKSNPVYDALSSLHARQEIFSYGISDSLKGISLYPLRSKTGVLVTGRPGPTQLPPPFSQVPGIGAGHQVHHKFVVCGFNGPDPTLFCGSSNLALGGEEQNGDNLLEIHDDQVATAFALEALTLVDHFDFLDRHTKAKGKGQQKPSAVPQQDAVSAGSFLATDGSWADKYFDEGDLHSSDRELFAR